MALTPITLVMRGTKVLVCPSGDLPMLTDVITYMVVISSYVYDRLIVVTSFTGEAPEDWPWVPLTEVQTRDIEYSDLYGEAILCGS